LLKKYLLKTTTFCFKFVVTLQKKPTAYMVRGFFRVYSTKEYKENLNKIRYNGKEGN